MHRPSANRRRLFLALFPAALLLAACGGGGGGPSTTLQLLLDPGSVTVLRGQAREVAVELRINAGTLEGTVDLSVTGLPDHVEATFTPSSLSAGQRESVLRLEVGAGAADGDHAIVVRTSGTGATQTTLNLEVQSLTVEGRVTGFLGLPPIETLNLASQGQTAVVDLSDGGFSLSGLSVPYDIDLWTEDGTTYFHRFEGLSSPTPLLQPASFGFVGPAELNTTVVGQLLGGDPVPAGRLIIVCIAGLDSVAFGCDRLGEGAVSYDISATWLSTIPEPARVVALYAEVDADGRPTLYRGYATVDLILQDGPPDQVADLPAFQPIGSALLNATFTVEGAGSAVMANVYAKFLPNLVLRIHSGPLTAPNQLQLLVPALPGMSYIATTEVGNRFAWGVSDGPEMGAILVPSVPTLSGLADMATGVDAETVFGSNHQGRMRTYTWQPVGAGLRIFLTTARDQVNLPDIGAHGLALPAGADYRWTVLGHGTTSVELAAAQNIPSALLTILAPDFGALGLTQNGALTVSAERQFQFAP